MNLTKEEIIKEIRDGSEIGEEIFKIELSYYKNLARIAENKASQQITKKTKILYS